MNPDIAKLLAEGPVSQKLSPHLARALNSTACRGETVRLLPGIYCKPGDDDVATRLAAVAAYGDDIAVTRRHAAAISWWPDIPLDDPIHLACPRPITPGYGMQAEHRLIHPDLLTRRNGVIITTPELTVLDLMPEMDADALDEALRRRAVSMDRMWRALQLSPRRRGNVRRREILTDSRDQPWSALEREGQRRLRAAGIKGWMSNYMVVINGRRYFLDVAFPQYRFAMEFDGWSAHGTEEAFHYDSVRDVDFTSIGWQVVHLTSRTVEHAAEVARMGLAQRRRGS